MLRALLLVVVALVAVSVASFTPECFKAQHQFEKCCKAIPNLKAFEKGMTECKPLMKPPPSCEADICQAKLQDIADSVDGKFDKTKLTEKLKTDLKDEPELAATLIKECAQGDLSSYGPPDFCDLTKLRHCFMSHVAAACKDWDSSAECQKTKETIQKCVS